MARHKEPTRIVWIRLTDTDKRRVEILAEKLDRSVASTLALLAREGLREIVTDTTAPQKEG